MENFRNTLREAIDSGDYEGVLSTIDLGQKKATESKENEKKFYDILEKGKNKIKKIKDNKRRNYQKNALIIINNYIENHKYLENLKHKEYTYSYHLLTKNRDLESFKVLVKKYSQFLNCLDENDNSLLYNIILDFINTLDLYYLKVIAYLLENLPPNYIQKDMEKVKDIIELDIDKNYHKIRELRILSNLLEHYFNQDSKLVNKDSLALVEKPIIKNGFKQKLDRIDYIDRENLTKLYTFAPIKNSEAFSFYLKDDIRKIYVHIIDLDEYIDKNSEADKYASYKVFGCIFDEDYLKDYVNFKIGENRLALTIEFEFDKLGTLKDTRIYKSVINVNECLTKDDKKIIKLKKIFENLFGFKDEDIKQRLHQYVEEQLTIICEKSKVPVIYRNSNVAKSIEEIMKYSGTTNFTKNFWTEESDLADDLIKELNNGGTIANFGEIDNSFDKKEVVIFDPGHNYLSLLNIRNIKKHLINKTKREELDADRDKVVSNAIIAESVSKKKHM